jgi:hypothetical protein
MSRSAAIIITLAGALASCLMSAARCPCGQSYDGDPFNPNANTKIGADHEESVHCFCRCADDPKERLPPSDACDAYEGPCQTSAGAIARYVCE